VELVDAAGKVVDDIGIEVRGASVREAGPQRTSMRR
jgi:penicillin-binding protein 1C